MSHLKCVTDKKRAMVINNKIIHRDGSKCNTPKDGKLEINKKTYFPTSENFHA